MPQWKWTIYESNELDRLLYEYLKSCKRMKDNIIQALEAFYLPYALKYTGASPLEVRKAYQRSIDTLQSRVKIMALDAGMSTDAIPQSGGFANENIQSAVSFNRQQLKQEEVDEVDDELPINPLNKITKIEK